MAKSDPPVEHWLKAESAGLRLLARAILHQDSDADDCVQDAYLAALRMSKRPEQPASWLRGVVRYVALHRLRDASRRQRRELAATKAPPAPSAASVAQDLELRQKVVQAVAAMEEPYRTTLVLRYFRELTPTQIATLQAAPVKTVKTRLSRGLQQLRRALDRAHRDRRAGWAPLLASIVPAGSVVAVKKSVAVAIVLLALGAGLVLWRLSDQSEANPPRSPEETPPVATAPHLQGAGTAARDAVPVAAGVLRQGDPVPEATFAGRVVDEGDRGVAGARVSLIWAGARSGSRDAANALHLIFRRERERRESPGLTTDAAGYFRFDRPYGSRSLLGVTASGFAPTFSGPHDSGSFALVHLFRSKSLTVRVSGSTGSPVAAAEVRLISPAVTFRSPRQELEGTRTDSSGTAALALVSGGPYAVEVVPDDPALGIAQERVPEGVSELAIVLPAVRVLKRRILDAETGQPVASAWVDVLSIPQQVAPENETLVRRVRASSDGVVRFSWQEGYYSAYASAPGYEVTWAYEDPIRLSRSMTIDGTISDPAGKPVAGAAILVAMGAGSVFAEGYVGRSPVAGWSDESGQFRVEVKLPHAFHQKEAVDRGVRTLIGLHPDFAPAVSESIIVVSGRSARTALRFPAPASLLLRVVDGKGEPMANQLVNVGRVLPRGSWPPSAMEFGLDTTALLGGHPSTTGADGVLLLDRMPPGLHVVRLETLRVETELREGERTELTLVRGTGPFIAGQVLDSKQRPVPGAMVALTPYAGTRTTDAQGRFRFDDLTEPSYELALRSEAHGGFLRYDRPVRPSEELRIQLPEPARLHIRVTGPSAVDIEYGLVTESGGYVGGGSGLLSSSSGDFETAAFTPGEGLFFVRAKGFGAKAARFFAPEGETTLVTLALLPSGSASGRVAEPSLGERGLVRLRPVHDPGQGIKESRPALWTAASQLLGSGAEHSQVSADGSFRFEDVTPGEYELSYGRYEERQWRALVAVQVEVTSGVALAANLPQTGR